MMRGVPFQSRPMAIGAHAAASTPHLLASEAAIDVLRRGGNAVDAAVAAAAVSAVVQPFTSSFGGVGWATVYDRRLRRTEVLQFHGAAPQRLDPSELHADPTTGLVDWRALEARGKSLLGSLVPGVVAGWEELLARKGRWTLGKALERAGALASEGFPVSELLAQTAARSAGRLARWPTSAVFLPGGRPLRVGERLVQTDLAATISRIASNGAEELVRGDTGQAYVDFFAQHGGVLTEEDLERYRPSWHEPLRFTFRGHTLLATPAPLGDVAFAAGLGLLDALPPFSGPQDPAYVHLSIETAKQVSAARARYLGPDTPPEVVDWLLSDELRNQLLAAIDVRARQPGPLAQASEDTITLAVIDEEGNAVNLMQTVGTLFGTGAVVGTTGILANSSIYFAFARPGGANRVVPTCGIEQNPCLALAFDPQGNLTLVIGSPGGKTRVETVRQMLVNILDFGMNPQQAVDAARFLVAPDGATVDFEQRYGPVDPALRAALESRGHRVSVVDEAFGSGQAIAIDPGTGARLAAADWRRESVALAY